MSPSTSSIGERGGLPREARIRRRVDFVRIQSQGTRVHTDAFVIIFAPRGCGPGPRLGLAVSRKVGPAVVRNRIRRILKEFFRRQASTLPAVDLVIVVKPKARALAEAGLAAVAQNLGPALRRALESGRSRLERGEGGDR